LLRAHIRSGSQDDARARPVHRHGRRATQIRIGLVGRVDRGEPEIEDLDDALRSDLDVRRVSDRDG
jgi:hypothetical protein